MDVSEHQNVIVEGEPGDQKLGGQNLIDTVVNLTELPEPLVPLVYNELDEILQMSGQNSGSLTLDELRTAMLAYLEAMHADLSAENPSKT